MLKSSRYPDKDSGKKTTWRDSDYEKAKIAISDDGDGLGIGFIKHFMPEVLRPRARGGAIFHLSGNFTVDLCARARVEAGKPG